MGKASHRRAVKAAALAEHQGAGEDADATQRSLRARLAAAEESLHALRVALWQCLPRRVRNRPLMLVSALVALLAVLAGAAVGVELLGGGGAAGEGVVKVEEQEMKQVLLGKGEEWVLQCARGKDPTPSKPMQLLHSELGGGRAAFGLPSFMMSLLTGGPSAEDELRTKARFGLIDCSHRSEATNKTVYERFGLKKELKPTVFVSVPWHKRKAQIHPENFEGRTTRLRKKALDLLSPMWPMVGKRGIDELKKKCDSRACALMVKGATYNRPEAAVEASILRALSPEVAFTATVKAGMTPLYLLRQRRRASTTDVAVLRTIDNETLAVRVFDGNTTDLEGVRSFVEESVQDTDDASSRAALAEAQGGKGWNKVTWKEFDFVAGNSAQTEVTPEEQRAQRRAARKARRAAKASEAAADGDGGESDLDLDGADDLLDDEEGEDGGEMSAEQRLEWERRRREEMDRQAQEFFIQENEEGEDDGFDNGAGDDDNGDDDDDDDDYADGEDDWIHDDGDVVNLD